MLLTCLTFYIYNILYHNRMHYILQYLLKKDEKGRKHKNSSPFSTSYRTLV